MTSSFFPPQRTLMGPGSSDVSPRVLGALSRPTIGHLDPLFVQLMDEIKGLLQYAFQTDNELTLPISAPGSAGMEACFVNLVSPGDQSWVGRVRPEPVVRHRRGRGPSGCAGVGKSCWSWPEFRG